MTHMCRPPIPDAPLGESYIFASSISSRSQAASGPDIGITLAFLSTRAYSTATALKILAVVIGPRLLTGRPIQISMRCRLCLHAYTRSTSLIGDFGPLAGFSLWSLAFRLCSTLSPAARSLACTGTAVEHGHRPLAILLDVYALWVLPS
jgi:hypothetical protein